ncbi:MAG: nucleoside hydrolase [Polyangiaceae bacterium]|nr:nucleoside hydrolase [Polyangiaceae bacterium]
MSEPFVIDTDTASDDAVALILALKSRVNVKAVTVVAGNVPLKTASRNARFTLELCGADIPVFEGADRPLLREPSTAQWFHGEDGLGDQGYPEPRMPPATGHGVSALISTIRANPGITVVTLGPMTNLALALAQAPDIAGLIGRCVVMGGAACVVGNVTPAAEYNIWCDPEAARMCFRSAIPIEMVGWEHCRGAAVLNGADIERIRAIGTPLARFAIDSNATALAVNRSLFHEDGIGLPDPVAMAVAIDPSLVTKKSKHAVDVECEGTLTRGMTVVDQLDVVPRMEVARAGWPSDIATRPRNVTVCFEIDAARFKSMLFEALS